MEKAEALRSLTDARGVIAVLAVDHRGNLLEALTKAAGRDVPADELRAFKAAVTRHLSPLASAMLLDPEYGGEAIGQRAAGAGLLLAYEKSGYDNTRPGRLPDLIPGQSVRRLKELGASGIKILLHYCPWEDAAVNQRKRAFIERIGAECRAEGVLFFLEPISYDARGADAAGAAFAAMKPEIVAASLAEFSDDRYGVDFLKAEIPVDLRFVEGAAAFQGPAVFTRQQALDAFARAAEAARRPVVFLSAGVSTAQFNESLEFAAGAGMVFHGVLCGRAVWNGGVAAYGRGGLPALEEWLATEGRRNLEAVLAALRLATPCDFGSGGEEADGLAAARARLRELGNTSSGRVGERTWTRDELHER